MKSARHALTAFAALAFVAATAWAPARAADTPAAAAGPVVEACKKDVETLCPGVQPGDGRIAACMKENRRKLSDGCKAALKAQRGAAKGAKPAA